MVKTFHYRIKESSAAPKLNHLARSVNQVWNFCNETQEHALRWNQRWPTGFDLNKLTAGCSKELRLHSQTVQAVCEEYAMRRKQSGKRKLRWRGRQSLGWIPFKASGVKVVEDTVTYCGQTFRFWNSRLLSGPIKTGNFAQDARGRWYVNFVVDVPDEAPTTGTKHIGVDLGLKTLATCLDGQAIPVPRFYRRQQQHLANQQRRRKSRRVRNLHAKIANRRKDFLHKESTRLIRECELIVVGNVSSSKLNKTNMAKSVNDASWSMFRRFLDYKAIAQKVVYREVSEHLTTQTCSHCHAVSGPKGRKGLGVREWVCGECGTQHDRDTNAALNILRLGHQSLLAEVQ
ncbi:MAG: transposase [Candidatus Competibacteraceae bacterium]|nr:transposase [Candidatus Competibacteraceae bacterium]MCP5126033.1 transposase [Gammaproteobacteria bacterium]HRX72189.1 transposase [Candidatus Competibacteraceae bacterium]